jgi:hypothetical protein
MERMGAGFVAQGFTVVSGNAAGADQAWARGASAVDPTKLVLCLPWESYGPPPPPGAAVQVAGDDTRLRDIAAKLHPAWGYLSSAVQRLHTRNIAIVEGAAAVFGYTSKRGGGTMMALRAAHFFGIPATDLRTKDRT